MLINISSLKYAAFFVLFLSVVALFITATSFIQLFLGVLLYPLLVFLTYKLFSARIREPQLSSGSKQVRTAKQISERHGADDDKNPSFKISDIDKRAFLKLIGATGFSFFLISIFGRKIEALLFGNNSVTRGSINQEGLRPTSATAPSPTDGYKISEIDNGLVGYYGFTNKDGSWLIMKEDTDSGSFRYAKGASSFESNWKNRENLKYDYFHNLPF